MKYCLCLFLCMAETQCYGKSKERSRVRAVQMVNLSRLLGIRRMNRVLNAWIRKLCGVKKGLGERNDGVFQWFSHVERMERDRIAKTL